MSGAAELLWEEALRRAGAGLPVEVDGLDPAQAADLLHRFLHDPGSRVPMEPFAGLLAAMLDRREANLWDLGGGEARAEAFLRDLPRDHPACLPCRCFPICMGYGAHANACETWRTVLEGLAAAARELAPLRRRAAQQELP